MTVKRLAQAAAERVTKAAPAMLRHSSKAKMPRDTNRSDAKNASNTELKPSRTAYMKHLLTPEAT
jgi:hypothetical protein